MTIKLFIYFSLPLYFFTQDRLYDIQDDILIKTRDGAQISAIIVKQKGDSTPRPTILQFTIYVRDKGRDLKELKELVDNGYVGVIAYTRGKRFRSTRNLSI